MSLEVAPQVHVLARVALALLGHRLDHRHQVVPGVLLDLLDPLHADDVEARDPGDLVGGFLRYGPEGRVCAGQGGLHLHLVEDAALLAEDGLHVFAAVAVVKGTDVAHVDRVRGLILNINYMRRHPASPADGSGYIEPGPCGDEVLPDNVPLLLCLGACVTRYGNPYKGNIDSRSRKWVMLSIMRCENLWKILWRKFSSRILR